jgi:hypothetical protein
MVQIAAAAPPIAIASTKQKLADAASAHHQAMENLQKQIDESRQNGDLAKAGDLQQKLDQLDAQSSQMKQMQQLSNQLGQMQQGLEKGDAPKTAEAMQQMAQQLSQMQQEANEIQMLDSAMDQLQMAKDAMVCPNCQGAGCEHCQQGLAMNSASQSDRPGKGIGKGRGNGQPPDEEPKTSTRDTQVRAKPGRGAAVFAGTIAGPNVKGEVEANIQQEMASFGTSTADPLTTEQLPRNRREHAEEYFNHLRDGK